MNTTEPNTPPSDPTWDSPPAAKPSTPVNINIDGLATMLSGFVEKLVALATQTLSPALVARVLGLSRAGGQFAVLAGIALTLVNAIIAGVRYRSFALAATGVGVAIAIVIAQYAATRFMGSSERIIAATPSRVSSTAFLECAGLLLLLGALALFIGGIYTAIKMSSSAALVSGIVVALLLAIAGAIALNPATAGVEIKEDASAGEEAVGLMFFCLKVWLKTVPLLFCLLAIAGCVVTIWSWFNPQMSAFALGGRGGALPLPFIDTFMVGGMAGPSLVLYACMTPVIVYLCFIFWSLTLDLARAILSLPAKLDALKK